jgi:hypothetical protein
MKNWLTIYYDLGEVEHYYHFRRQLKQMFDLSEVVFWIHILRFLQMFDISEVETTKKVSIIIILSKKAAV